MADEAPKSFIADDEDDEAAPEKVSSVKVPKSFQPDKPVDKTAAPVNHADNPDVDRLLSQAKTTLGNADAFDKSISAPAAEKPKSTDNSKDSILNRFADSVSTAIVNHPKVVQTLKNIASIPEHQFSQSEADTINQSNPKNPAKAGDVEPRLGEGMMAIPGAEKTTDYLSQKVAGDSGNLRLGAGAVVKAVGDILSTGFDPRNVGAQQAIHDGSIDVPFKSEPAEPSVRPEINQKLLPETRVSSETPYRMSEETPAIKQTEEITPAAVDKSEPVSEAVSEPKAPQSFVADADKPTAVHMGTQPAFDNIPETHYYNIKGGPDNGTTVTEEGLKARGIDTPELDQSKIGKTGDQLRKEALLARGKVEEGQLVLPENETKTTSKISPEDEKAFNDSITEHLKQPPEGQGTKNDLHTQKVQANFVNPFEKSFITETPKSFISDEPQAAKTEGGKLAIGADIKSLGKVLGTSLYKGDIAPIATKELLQNSIDAVRHLGSDGNINVLFDRVNHAIHVTDNGKGLTKDELETVFTNLGASGKREDVNAAGGFGLAKAAPLLGGKNVEVNSIARDIKTNKLIKSSFNGTPEDLLNGVDIKQEEVPEGTSTGTSVKVYVSEESNFYGSREFVSRLIKNSPNIKSNISVGSIYDKNNEPYMSEEKPGKTNYIATLDNPTAKIELSTPESATKRNAARTSLHLSNNGMYQGTKNIYFNSEVPNLPSDIIADIRSKVPEGHPDYPFTANREELRGSVEEQVNKYIDENIIKPAQGARREQLKRLYESMPEVTVGNGEFPNNFGRKISLYDPKGQINPNEMNEIITNPSFKSLANNISNIINNALKTVDNPEWTNRLEKIGILFDDNNHGIHIPNPGSGKSAILINPFPSIRDMTPDQASANILHTILHELAHVEPSSPGHNESFTIRLGDIYAKYGARKSVGAQDAIEKSITDGVGNYNPEIQKVLSIYQSSRGNPATTEDLLSGTGIKSKAKSGGENSIPKSNKSNGERTSNESVTIQSALDKLFNAMGSVSEKRVSQDILNKAETAKRFAAYESVQATGRKGAVQRLSTLKGDYEKVDTDKLKLGRNETNVLFDAINNAKIPIGEKIRGTTALFKLINGAGVPQRNELSILNDVFGNNFADRIIEMHGGLNGVGLQIGKAANTMKSMLNSVNIAAPLLHGLPMIAKSEFHHAFGEMIKYMGNKEYYDAAMQAIEDHSNYIPAKESGLFLAKPGSLTKGEEDFANSYIGNIPRWTGIPQTVSFSQRGYSGFLNTLRFKVFNNLIENAKDMGLEPLASRQIRDDKGNFILDSKGNVQTTKGTPTKLSEDIAKYINNSTDRGSLGRLNKIAPELNYAIWSPRRITARLTQLNPKYYMDLEPMARKEALKSLLAMAAAGTTMVGLGVAAGGKTSLDLNNPDFGKVRFGTHTLNPLGPTQSIIVAAARMLQEVHRLGSGQKAKFGEQSIPDIATNFIRNRESPIVHLADEIASARQFTHDGSGTNQGGFVNRFGEKKYVSTEIRNSFTPIFVQDMENLLSSDKSFTESVGLGAASFVGVSGQDYPEKAKKSVFKIRRPSVK